MGHNQQVLQQQVGHKHKEQIHGPQEKRRNNRIFEDEKYNVFAKEIHIKADTEVDREEPEAVPEADAPSPATGTDATISTIPAAISNAANSPPNRAS